MKQIGKPAFRHVARLVTGAFQLRQGDSSASITIQGLQGSDMNLLTKALKQSLTEPKLESAHSWRQARKL